MPRMWPITSYGELNDLRKEEHDNSVLHEIIKEIMLEREKDEEEAKVDNLSNYQCRLVSRFLKDFRSRENGNGVTMKDGSVKLPTFKCSNLSNHVFKIPYEHLNEKGFGIDAAAMKYLSSTLEEIRSFSQSQYHPLVPLYADGDGYCLVHAVSRCLIGRELLWHPLMTDMQRNIIENKSKYENLLRGFSTSEEIDRCIEEASPDYRPQDGAQLGLTYIHILALANVLRRPIILLDELNSIQFDKQYACLFLPVFVDQSLRLDKEGAHNRPIFIAWSSRARNHFVPLVGIKGTEDFCLPCHLLPKQWGSQDEDINSFIDFDEKSSSYKAGSGKSISVKYLQNLVLGLENDFFNYYGIAASVIEAYYHQIEKPNNLLTATYQNIVDAARIAVSEESLLKCTTCSRIRCMENPDENLQQKLLPGGEFFETAVKKFKSTEFDFMYEFPFGPTCRFNAKKKRLFILHKMAKCEYCQGELRALKEDGEMVYLNGDIVKEICTNGKEDKVFWNGELYDAMPVSIDIVVHLKEKSFTETISWFYKERDQSRNSNAFEIAKELVEKYFDGEPGLVKIVANEIMRKTEHLGTENRSYLNPWSDKRNVSYSSPGTRRRNCGGSKKKATNRMENVVQKAATTSSKTFGRGSPKSKSKFQKSAPVNGQKVKTEGETKVKQKIQNEGKASSDNVAHSGSFKICLNFNGKKITAEITDKITYGELQNLIKNGFGIEPEQQVLKTGYPRMTLSKPRNEDEALALAKGDTVFIDEDRTLRMQGAVCERLQRKSEGARCEKTEQDMKRFQGTGENIEELRGNVGSWVQQKIADGAVCLRQVPCHRALDSFDNECAAYVQEILQRISREMVKNTH